RKIGHGQADLIQSPSVGIQRDALFQHSAVLPNCVRYSELIENAHRIRPHQYGRTNFQKFRRLLKNPRLESELPYRKRRGQAANTAANDRDAHRLVSICQMMRSVTGAVATGPHLATIKLTETHPVATAPGTDLHCLLLIELSAGVQIIEV